MRSDANVSVRLISSGYLDPDCVESREYCFECCR